MTNFRPGGNRRIDRVLSPDFTADLRALSMDDLRARRAMAEQEEVDLSYLRRLLQGRIDIVRAELRRRAGDSDESLVDHLPEVLAEQQPATAYGLGRHSVVEPSRVADHRRRVESLVADVGLSDFAARTDEELRGALEVYTEEEGGVSGHRRAVQKVMDVCSTEVARRYREGEADVATILEREQR